MVLLTGAACQLRYFRAVDQAQKLLEFAAIVRLDDKPASIKSERSICISTVGSHRQLSNCCAEACGYDKNEQKGESDEPETPLLGEVDVVIRGEQINQLNNSANNGFQQDFAVKTKPPPGQCRIQVSRGLLHLRQHIPITLISRLVHACYQML